LTIVLTWGIITKNRGSHMAEEHIPYLRSDEVCKQLGVNYHTLHYMRKTGKIEAMKFGTSFVYTQEQVDNARLERDKPGPKAGSKRGKRQKRDEGTGNISSSVASVCEFSLSRHHVADLVGV
jgi:hypothetical protein